jgi:hypothetical protein
LVIISSTLMLEAVHNSETSINSFRISPRYIHDGSISHIYHPENVRYSIINYFFNFTIYMSQVSNAFKFLCS